MLSGLVCGPKPRTKRVQETWYKLFTVVINGSLLLLPCSAVPTHRSRCARGLLGFRLCTKDASAAKNHSTSPPLEDKGAEDEDEEENGDEDADVDEDENGDEDADADEDEHVPCSCAVHQVSRREKRCQGERHIFVV
jgi:hypothetical protein